MMGLPDSQETFMIALAVQAQYRRVRQSHRQTHLLIGAISAIKAHKPVVRFCQHQLSFLLIFACLVV